MISLCIGLLYVWLALTSTKNTWAGFYALVYIMVACWLIWYPDLVSKMHFSSRFRTHLRIPPIYIRYVGWVLLLGPAAVAIAGGLVVTIAGRKV